MNQVASRMVLLNAKGSVFASLSIWTYTTTLFGRALINKSGDPRKVCLTRAKTLTMLPPDSIAILDAQARRMQPLDLPKLSANEATPGA